MAVVALGLAAPVRAGGLMTNTNYHIAFDRMMARGASFDIDAAYSNPAGLAWTKEGWQLSLNFQKPWQYRDIKLTVPPPTCLMHTLFPPKRLIKARRLHLSCLLFLPLTKKTAGPFRL